ncbi:VOC family protein [Putridiphycobacter roseus]|uniref:VOC family protein n=2 Tax=Putridiphycobacter roseus TaxID=2219161 RepID=A0A2W1NL18_9FLAO|nr:VOC family protein [Putridiphycobacter roseus]
MMNNNNHINYIEFKATNLAVTKAFYKNVFGWTFTDYGENYTSFENSGVAGGFEKTNDPIQNGVLVVIHHENLSAIKTKIIENKGEITQDIFSFPGGKRFQFKDPSGNELAVWTEDEG